MKKLLWAIVFISVAPVLAFVMPRMSEYLLQVDNSAASALGARRPENLGRSIVSCLNQHNRFGVWWDLNSVEDLRAHQDLGGSWSNSHYVIAGRIGWHVTWAAIVPLEAEAPIAYESFGAEGNMDGAIFRTELPARIVGSLKRCGVTFGGVYPGAIPF